MGKGANATTTSGLMFGGYGGEDILSMNRWDRVRMRGYLE